jgi:hypothetical protein
MKFNRKASLVRNKNLFGVGGCVIFAKVAIGRTHTVLLVGILVGEDEGERRKRR